MPKATRQKKIPNAKFDYSLDFKNLDLRAHPELYKIGLGEQGVLSVEPYKSELVCLWRFKTPDIARTSSQDLKAKFYEYLENDDFIGMDMTRKFIQMGVTRARRYANWSGGKKYTGELDENGKKIKVIKGPEDKVKAECARIFGVVLKEVQENEAYKRKAEEHRERYERASRDTTTGTVKEDPDTKSEGCSSDLEVNPGVSTRKSTRLTKMKEESD